MFIQDTPSKYICTKYLHKVFFLVPLLKVVNI